MPPSPAVQQRVSVGVQTVAGYAASAGTFAAPLIAWAADANLPVPVQVTLIIVGGALAGITGRNRSDQAVANTAVAEAATYNATRPAPAIDADATADDGPATYADLDAVDQPDEELRAGASVGAEVVG